MSLPERVKALEVKIEDQAHDIAKHESLLSDMRDSITKIVHDLTQIKNALWAMAGAITLHLPYLKDALSFLRNILSP